MHIGNILKQERENQNYTQKEIAKLMGVEQQNISYWERKAILNIDIVKDYASALGCEFRTLLVKKKDQ